MSRTWFRYLLLLILCMGPHGCDPDDRDATGDIDASFRVWLTGDGDGCGIPGWTIATQDARLVLSGTKDDLSVTLEPATEASDLTLLAVKGDGLLRGTGDASDFKAEGLSDGVVGKCEGSFRISIEGKDSAGTLLGTITYEPVDPCPALTGCQASQVFSTGPG